MIKTTSISKRSITKWFYISNDEADKLIKVPTGRGAFYDSIEYLTHEHPKQIAKGKKPELFGGRDKVITKKI